MYYGGFSGTRIQNNDKEIQSKFNVFALLAYPFIFSINVVVENPSTN